MYESAQKESASGNSFTSGDAKVDAAACFQEEAEAAVPSSQPSAQRAGPPLSPDLAVRLFGYLCEPECASRSDAPDSAGVAAGEAGEEEVLQPPADLRGRVEQHTGTHLDSVRIHVGAHGQRMAADIGAKAYAVGADLYFAADQYRPGTPDGDRLIIHELAHSAQHQQAGSPTGAQQLEVAPSHHAAEQEADAVAHAVMADRSGEDTGAESARKPARVTPAASAIYRSPDPETLGTAKTTAPIAKNAIQPQRLMQAELDQEVSLFQRGQSIISWIERGRSLSPDGTFRFTLDELFAATQTAAPQGKKGKSKQAEVKSAQLGLQAKTPQDLKPVLEILIHYGVINGPSAQEANYTVNFEKKVPYSPNALRSSDFDEANRDISAFSKKFRQRVQAKSPQQSVVDTALLPMSWSSDLKAVHNEKAAAQNLDDLQRQLDEFIVFPSAQNGKPAQPVFRVKSVPREVKDESGQVIAWEIEIAGQAKPLRMKDPPVAVEQVGTGSHEVTKQRREQLITKVEKAKKTLKSGQVYRTFAKDNLVLFKRLRELNTKFSVGTYEGHSWAEFSADIFISAGFDAEASGFWDRKTVRQFFDDLNTAAEKEDGEAGKFAWRGIYNDDPLAAEVNAKYGSERVIHVPHHGPHPDKLHIHLDLRPVELKKDASSGYTVEDGRVHLNSEGSAD